MKARTILLTVLLAATPAAAAKLKPMSSDEIVQWRAGVVAQIQMLQAQLITPITKCPDKTHSFLGGIADGAGAVSDTVSKTTGGIGLGSKSAIQPCLAPAKTDDSNKKPATNQK